MVLLFLPSGVVEVVIISSRRICCCLIELLLLSGLVGAWSRSWCLVSLMKTLHSVVGFVVVDVVSAGVAGVLSICGEGVGRECILLYSNILSKER